jgi:rod shape-determining protein MreC
MLNLWRNRPLMVTIIVVIILLVVLVITAGSNNMSGTESVVGSIFSPVQKALYSATDAIGDFFDRIFSGSDLQAENLELEAKVAELEGQLEDYSEVKAENDRLKVLLNFDPETEEPEIKTAHVIGKTPGHWFNYFTIDVGIADGIKVDMPVVNGDGLVGRVFQTGANFSRVLAIIDSSSGVSCIVERTRDLGTISGSNTAGDENPLLTMSNLPLDADLMPGDIVITSGLASTFPIKGVRVGEVVEVSQSNDGMRNEAVVKPFVDFAHLEEVIIITSKFVNTEEALE